MKQKAFFLVWQFLSFKIKKQTSKNVPDTTFKSCTCSYTLFSYTMCFVVVNFDKIHFSCIGTSSFLCIQSFFSKMKLVKTSLHTQLNQANLENKLHISTEGPTEGFNDSVFQHYLDELKRCNSNMRIELQLLVLTFLYLYSIYLVGMLSFRMIFFHNLFCFFFLVNF